jgi:2-polyprenyl-3-methyl-5-hydroxy-6-metoxy-1,4-benzoquinol methylase
MEVVRAGMLSRHVKPGGAKVLQLGGTTKDVYYYPKGTTQITVMAPDVSVGLMETAGMNAGVPVSAVKVGVDKGLQAQAGSSVDSIVAFDQLGQVANVGAFVKEAQRVLRPGGTLVFVQRINGSPVAGLLRLGSSGAVGEACAMSVLGGTKGHLTFWIGS